MIAMITAMERVPQDERLLKLKLATATVLQARPMKLAAS